MQALKKLIPDLLLVAGATSVSYGAWEISPPLSYVVAGMFAIYTGLRLA